MLSVLAGFPVHGFSSLIILNQMWVTPVSSTNVRVASPEFQQGSVLPQVSLASSPKIVLCYVSRNKGLQ